MIELDRSALTATVSLASAQAGLAATTADAAGMQFVAQRSAWSYTSMQPRLTDAQHWKCAYCEDYLRTRMIEVDHIRPKDPKHYWWLAFSLENLVATCRSCNNKKSNEWELLPGTAKLVPRETPWVKAEPAKLVDPTMDDGEEHFRYLYEGGLWRIAARSDRGRWTIEKLELDRDYFIYEANKWILDAIDDKALAVAAAKREGDRPKYLRSVAGLRALDHVEIRWTQMIRTLVRSAIVGDYHTPQLPLRGTSRRR